jgi:hypothetical protein
VKFTDFICGSLRQWQYKFSRRIPSGDKQQTQLTRITDDKDGNTCRPVTARQQEKGKNVGNPCVLNCFVCRRYIINGASTQQHTSWWCASCHMPLCKSARNGEGSNRKFTCLEEHLSTEDSTLGCNVLHHKGTAGPEHLLHINLTIRKSKRKKV